MKRSSLVEGYGIPLDRVLAPANRHDSPLLAPTLDKLDDLGPLPDDITVHLDAGYDSQKTRDELASRGMTGEIAHKGDKAPIQAGQRWHVERTNAWHNSFNRLQRCYERNEDVIDAFFDLADTIITVRSLIRRHGSRTGGTAARRSDHDQPPIRAASKTRTTKTMAGAERSHCDSRGTGDNICQCPGSGTCGRLRIIKREGAGLHQGQSAMHRSRGLRSRLRRRIRGA